MVHSILVLHGPNLNLLGTREPEIYGALTLADINHRLQAACEGLGLGVQFLPIQLEGDLIDALQTASRWAAGVVFNPAGYTHTSVALRDTIAAIRSRWLKSIYRMFMLGKNSGITSLLAPVCRGKITGFGWHSYWLGIQALAAVIRGDEAD